MPNLTAGHAPAFQQGAVLHGLVPMFDRPLGLGIGQWAEGMLEGLLRQLLREDVGDTSCLFGSDWRPYRTEQKWRYLKIG